MLDAGGLVDPLELVLVLVDKVRQLLRNGVIAIAVAVEERVEKDPVF